MDKKKSLIWALIISAAVLALVCLGLMIWGAVVLGININQHTGDYHTFLLGGLLTGINAFVFLFINLNLFSYLSSHKFLITNAKNWMKSKPLKKNKLDSTERI